MTRRLVMAIVATVVATLLVAGFGTLVLTVRAERTTAERELRVQASDFATAIADSSTPLVFLNQVRKALKLADVGIVTLANPTGPNTKLPTGIALADVRVDALRQGLVVSGRRGSIVYAAATAATRRGQFAIVLTRHPDSPLRPAFGWFFLAAVGTLILATLVAVTLSRRLTKPLRDARAATHRIADGQFSTRIPMPARGRRDELTDLTHSINVMASTLERSQTLEQRFLLSVSHDLRTPLTSIRGYAEAIADGAVRDPASAAGVILSEATRLERLVRDLLDLAKLEQRAFTFSLATTDLATVADRTANGFAPGSERDGVAVLVSAPVRVLVTADPDRLAQVVANLTENAFKYSRSRIIITAFADRGDGVITIDDDGPGIAPEDQPHVFERLYRSKHEPVRREVGSGLGLAIVRELVHGMGGSVGAEAAPGGGARMTVRLPLAPQPPSASTSTLTPPADPVSGSSTPLAT